jgi:acetoin utilization protein AcuB
MLINRVMIRNPVWTRPDTSVKEAQDLMDKERISRLPVLDKHDKLCGIAARKDLAKASPSMATSLDIYEVRELLSKVKVSDVMEKHVVTVDENEVVEEAARVMVDRNITCLPVMRRAENTELLVGIITASDLFKVLLEAFGARRPGIRAIITMTEKPGQLARLTGAIAEAGGNIITGIDGMTIEDIR